MPGIYVADGLILRAGHTRYNLFSPLACGSYDRGSYGCCGNPFWPKLSLGLKKRSSTEELPNKAGALLPECHSLFVVHDSYAVGLPIRLLLIALSFFLKVAL